ncbi:RAVE protein 1 C terminal-domain-containing protein [Polychytrium aggregatum]|uniref:RAVE protein 1 C terminal-domain-containing protein n=1 Tax=Polychytrium aggregatum TaxID=110093 RepID=UPI0022FDF3D1|nr:RAVE protein 1 C terminal-domain-containing protein [Polychytrium aggregatum]KAI9202399.1 RAVE protein 1 C terminal-domain-containing protein [Polychytrium aggregatum]
MQLLQHVIAGKPNASPGSMATALFRDTRYVIYGCGAKIIVFRSDFTFLQSLSHPDDGDLEVSCVAMSGTSGLIIAGYRDQIVLYLPHEIAPKKFTWEYSETLQANFLLRYLAFHPMGSFLAAGNYLVLYTQRPDRSHLSDISAPNPDSAGSDRWKAAWSTSLANDVHKAEFSPDGHFISTFSMYDRVVKIWYSKETSGADSEDVDFDFTYLLHPRSVVSTEWRYRDAKYTRVPADNVLMTLSLDNICRLWSQTTQQFPFVFHMAALINPRSFPGSNEDLTTADEGLSPVHWIHSEAINEALALREMEESKYRKKKNAKGTTNERRSRRVKEKLKDYPDMLFRIEPTGSMIVWGVQHLTSKPRCIPKVLVIMRAEDSLIRSDYEFFLGNVFVFCNRPAIQHSSIYFPAELLFLGQAVDGSVNAYIMSLDEFLGTSIGNTYLRLTYSWCGHRASVRRVTRHPNMPFVSTTGRDGELIIFETTNPKIGARTTSGLDALGGRTGAFSEHPLQAWIPGVPLLIAYEKSELSIVHVQAGRVIQSTAVVDSWIPDLAMIHLYHDGGEDVASVESLVQARYYLIGVARDTTVYVWTIELGPTTKVATTLVAANRLELSSALKYVVATDSLSTVYGPVAPLGPHLFMTVCEGDDATLWHINGGSFQSIAKNSSWVPVSRFKLEAEGVLGIYPHTFGKLAIHRQVIGGSRVEVWCNNISSLSYRKEWELTTRDDIVGLDWYFTSDGQHLLLCGHPDRVEIYGQQRRRANENLPSWSTISNFTALGTEIVAWLGNGSILVGKKDHIDIYDKWFEDQSDTSSPYNIFVGASRLNGSLPEHHPLVLIQNLIWGHYDLVKYQLSFLHRFVQLLFQSNRTIIDVPVPLWKLFEDEASPAASIQHYDSLFAAEDGQRDQTVVGEFTSSQATFLSEQLTYVSLPRITNVDQMLLVALIDTFSQIEAQKRSLDENGGRFLLFMKLWLFSQKSFPPAMRSMELSSRDVAWAYFSESQDLLIESCNAALGSKLNWKDARAFGMGYWIKNLESLRRVIESIARNQYMANDDKNPVDCSLFYIAMRKKNVLLGLWKLANAHPEQASMLRFLANDFAEERWKKAAIKNAFALLGKQRYEYAVAFFLLGDSPKDAVNVCFKHLNDPQLALVICRLFEGDESSLLLDVVTTTLIPEALRRGDRWLASVAYSIIKKRSESLLVTLMPMDTFIPDREPDSVHAPVDPELLVLFYHLKGYYKSLRIALPQTPPAREAEFICQCAEAYIEMGCPLLALQIMKRLEPLREEQLRQDASKSLECADKGHDIGTTEATGVMNWRDHGPGGTATATTTGAGPPTASEIHESIDWSQPVATQTSASLDWNQLGGAQRADQFDWGAPVSNQDDGFDWGQPIGSTFPSALGTGASMFDEYKSTLDHDDDSNNDDGIDTVSREMVGDDGGKSQAASALEDVNHALGHVSGEQRLQYELECRNIMVHQWMLAMRSIQAVYQSTTVVSLNMDVLQVEEAFRDYFERLRGSICRLSSQVSIPITLIEQMLDMRCKEMDSVITYSEFLPLQETSTEYATKYVKFVEDQCNVLSRIVFGPPLKLEDSGHGTEYHIWLAKRLLWSIVRWQDKAQNGSCTKSLHTVIMGASCTAFLAIIISRLKQKSYRKIRWLLSLCDGFFEILLGKNMSDLWRIIESIVRDDEIDVPAIVTEEAAADDNRETFDEHQDETAAVSEETRMTAELLVQTLRV